MVQALDVISPQPRLGNKEENIRDSETRLPQEHHSIILTYLTKVPRDLTVDGYQPATWLISICRGIVL